MSEPTTNARITGVMPMNSESRAPTIRRESMSRPSSSVPSGWPSKPMGFKRFIIDEAYGSDGTSQGPNTARMSRMATTTAAPMATRSRMKRRPTVCQ